MGSSKVYTIPSPAPIARPKSWAVTPLLVFLLPTTFAALVSLPFLCFLSIVPIVGFFSLPTLLSVSLYLLYSIAWSLYLLFAQSDPPTNVSLPFLPLSPVRCTKVTLYFLRFILDSISARGIDLFFDLQVRRVMVLGGKGAKKIIKENVLYAPGKRLDVYLPASRGGLEREDAAPVIVILGGGNWSFWRKRSGAQIALRLRRLGYVVVVPEIAQWPKARLPEMVQDLRHVLEWAGERVEGYGGDGERIFLLGYGSGAHVSLLTVVQDAVVRSRDAQFAAFERGAPEVEISAGIRRCQIWGEEARLPKIAGAILISGVFDLIKQLRFEAKLGIEDLSALRRACGPSTGATLLSCPSHLLFGSKEILDPTLLPPKILIIAGGKDRAIPYSQSVLLRSLLTGVGIETVRLKLYREETHLGSLASLMHQTRYSPLILAEIESLIASDSE